MSHHFLLQVSHLDLEPAKQSMMQICRPGTDGLEVVVSIFQESSLARGISEV
jgi:hypothetical protein